jgi:DNA-directed RNA polymerase subunit K/omega
MSVQPVDLLKLSETTESLYEAIVVMSRRARQVNDEIKAALTRELAEVITIPLTEETDEPETNYDQMRISKQFDKLRPTEIAVDEMLRGELEYRYREPEPEV